MQSDSNHELPALQLPEDTYGNRKKRNLWRLPSLLLLGAAFGYSLASVSPDAASSIKSLSLTKAQKALFFSSLLGGGFFCIVVHELGHVFGGWLAGFSFHLLIVGPLRLTKSDTGLKLSLNRNVGLMGGLALSLPRTAENLRSGLLKFIAGGPAASFVFGALCYGVSYLVPASQWGSVISTCLSFVGCISLLVGFITIFPGMSGGFKTDGRQLIELSRSGSNTETQHLLRLAFGVMMTGTRPRDLSTDWVSQIKDGMENFDPPNTNLAASLLYSIELDIGNLKSAHEYMQVCLDTIGCLPEVGRRTHYLEAAFFEGYIRRDAGQAQAFYKLPGSTVFVDPYQVLRAESAIAIAASEFQAAKNKANEALAAIDRSPYRSMADMPREQLESIVAEASQHVDVTADIVN